LTERLHPILLTVITFLGVCFTLIGFMPSWIMTERRDYRKPDIPEELAAEEHLILNFSDVEFINATKEGAWWESKVGGHDIKIMWDQELDFIGVAHLDIWRFAIFVVYTGEHGMEWSYRGQPILETDDGILENVSRIDDYFDDGAARFKLKCDHFHFHFLLYYQTENYTKFSDAFAVNDFGMVIGLTFDQTATTLSSWDLINAILFFQAPQIHPLLNFIIALPLLISIAFLIYEFIRRLIPFLP